MFYSISMCGIIAVSGTSNVINEVVLGLKRLEYRGYDSSGTSFLLENGDIMCNKYKGRVSILEEKLKVQNLTSNVAMGHTRWATHGIPSDINAHPHTNGEISIVHNGIIENYASIKENLISKGYTFKSQTDTEVGMVLLYDLMKRGLSKFEALKKFFDLVHGSFAIVVIFKNDNKIYGIKKGSPMVIGYAKDKNFIASDVYAIAGMATHVSYVQDGEIVIIKHDSVEVFNSKGEAIKPLVEEIKIKPNDLEKGPYEHYMLKEIFEQSGAIRNNILNHYDVTSGEISFPFFTDDTSRFKFVKIISCGTSHNSGYIAKFWFEKYAKVEVFNEIASEFRYKYNNLDLEDTLYIFISQSGETADTINALKYVNENKIKSSRTLAVVNVVESQIAKYADAKIECFSGPEIGVAATKSFTSQLISLAFLALKMSFDKSLLTREEVRKIVEKEIHLIPTKIDEFLGNTQNIKEIDLFCQTFTQQIKNGFKVIYVGRGVLYGICMEATLKTQELFYVPILSFSAGELKHGPIAILDETTLVLVLANTDYLYDKTSSSIEEISVRGADVTLIANSKHEKAKNFINTSIFGDFHDISAPILYAIPVHLISYKTALLLGNDVDKPRGLAKSVTVE